MSLVTQRASGGMVSAPHARAAQSGASVLADGGTAIEAAMAVAATLTVVYPHMTGLGGDSFWLLAAPDAAPVTIDGAGRAGSAVTPTLYRSQQLSSIPWRGPLAANTVAGAVSAWAAAGEINRQWGGVLSLARLFKDAAAFADGGITVSASHADALQQFRVELETQPGFSALHWVDGGVPRVGDRLRQPALARTFEWLADEGLEGFYRGRLAEQLSAELCAAGAPLAAQDLAGQRAVVGSPLVLDLPDSRIFNCRPPSQGLASLMILGLFARLGVTRGDSFEHVHGLVECTKSAFRIRDREVGDPQRAAAPLERYLDAGSLDRAAAAIDRRRAAPWGSERVGGDTVWFGVIDREGRAVSAIQSLYFEFGSGVALPISGFVWQNRGCAFQLEGSGPNVLGPGRQPFHTLNPGLARFRDGRVMVYGAMGGDGQPQTQAALFTRHAFFGQDLQTAITAPRWVLGRTWRDTGTALRVESRFPDALVADLESAGHRVERVQAFDQAMGHAGAVVRGAGTFEGASDPRSDGAAIGC